MLKKNAIAEIEYCDLGKKAQSDSQLAAVEEQLLPTYQKRSTITGKLHGLLTLNILVHF